jgi:hypothetical protein
LRHLARTPLAAGTEARLARFTELAGTAVANAEAPSALAASRARIMATGDATRRRIEVDRADAQPKAGELGTHWIDPEPCPCSRR